MTRLSKRLEIITKFIDENDGVVDIGCDHGFLPIYLVENKICKKVLACDINKNALNNANENIKKRELNIKTFLSDGLTAVPLDGINTLVISGMGTGTILHILKDNEKLNNIKKIIIQSNNDWEILRKELNNKGYYLEDEENTLDKNKWYITCYFIRRDKKNNSSELEFGFLKNKEYANYLLSSYKKTYHKIPLLSIKEKLRFFHKIKRLKTTIKNK